MRIRTLLAATVVFFGLVIALISVSLTATNRKVQLLNEQADAATSIEHGASELMYLSNEYVLDPREQIRKRWRSTLAAISKDLSGLKPESPEQLTMVTQVRANIRRLDGVFTDIGVALNDKDPAEPAASVTQVSWSRMAVQTQLIAFDARRITHLIRDEQGQIAQTNLLLIYALLSAFSAFLIAGYYIGYRRLLRSLSELHAGTNIVGSGDLSYAIPVKRKDEIGELSLAFNRMTGDLRAVTASKTELEAEIRERIAAEQALHAEEERLSVTLRSIGDGVIATDMDARVVLLNGVAEELTGWKAEDAMGRPIAEVFDIISEETREAAVIPVQEALETGRVVELANHTALIAKDGTELSIADSCAPIRAHGGEIIGAVLVFRDVTEQHLTEKLRDALNDINSTLGSTLDIDSVMHTVTEKAVRALDCEGAVIRTRTEGAWETRHVFGLPDSASETRLMQEDAEASLIAEGSRPPVVWSGDDLMRALSPGFIDGFQVTSAMHALVTTKAKITGDLTFFNLTNPRQPLGIERDFAQKLASSLSFALENARLYEAERNIAQTLQEAVISMPKALPGIEFSHLYRSATKTAKVGGDFYDIFQIGPGKIGIVLGDVAGKGVSAAMLTVLVQNTIKALAHQGYSPCEILSRTNDLVTRETPAAVFVTVFFCMLDTEAGHLNYCCAGHPPALLKRKTGGTELLGSTSPIVGAFEGLPFSCTGTPLEPGDTLVLYTDGVTEARRTDGEFFGQDRLVSVVDEPKGASHLSQHIFEQIQDFTSGKSNDDVAILSISLAPRLDRPVAP